MYHTLSQKVVQKIATYKSFVCKLLFKGYYYQSFVQYEIGEKYMDDLSQCPKNYCYIYDFSTLLFII